MGDIYIDTNYTGNEVGTSDEPWSSVPAITSNNNYWIKRGSQIDIGLGTNPFILTSLSNVKIGAYYIDDTNTVQYDDNTTLPKPIITNYLATTSTFTDIGNDTWTLDTGKNYPIILGLTTIDNWKERVNYYGIGYIPQKGTANGIFDTYGQWDGDNTTYLAIYNNVEPVSAYNTVYYSQDNNGFCVKYTNTISCSIENINFKYAGIGILLQSTTASLDNTIDNCDFEHCFRGIVLSNSSSTTTLLNITNNEITNSGNIGIHFSGAGNKYSVNIQYNRIINTGAAESIGAIYGRFISPSPDSIIIQNNYIDKVYGTTGYWTNEQRGIYLESGSKNTLVARNYCNNIYNAGLHSNSGLGPNKFIFNIVNNSWVGYGESDSISPPNDAGNHTLYNNLFYNVARGINISHPTSNGNCSVTAKNNILFGNGTYFGINLNANADNGFAVGNTFYEDNNVIYNFSIPITRDGSINSLQHVAGSNDIYNDPLLSEGYRLLSTSQCIGAGEELSYTLDYLGDTIVDVTSYDIGPIWYMEDSKLLDYFQYKLNPPKYNPAYPPGSVKFSDQFVGFIEANESLAVEIENARDGLDTLSDNLDTILKYNLEDRVYGSIIPGEEYRFTRMSHGVDPADYVNKIQVQLKLAPQTVETTPVGTINIPNAIIQANRTGDAIDYFDQGYTVLPSQGLYQYFIPEYNRSYIHQPNAATMVLMDNIIIPIPGDKIILLIDKPSYPVVTVLMWSYTKFMGRNPAQNITTQNNRLYIEVVYINDTYGWYVLDFRDEL